MPTPVRDPVKNTGQGAREVHEGPFRQETDNPCIIVCESCGKRMWEHDYQPCAPFRMSSGYQSSEACSVCHYRYIPAAVLPSLYDRSVWKEGYVKDQT
jgi:hypothetical protein